MEPFEIRRCETRDVEFVTRLWRRSRDAVQPELEERMGYSDSDDLEFFRDVLVKTCDVWLITGGRDPVGFLALKENSIEQLYIDPVAQGKGFGSTLIEYTKRCSPIRLELHTHLSNNKARRFYEHHGFQAVEFGTSPAPESEPDVKYVWRPEPSDGRPVSTFT